MDINRLQDKLRKYHQHQIHSPSIAIQKWEQAFEIEYTHESTAIEGNTLTLMETKVILEDALSVGGKNLREIYEVVNHRKAFHFIQGKIKQGIALDETIVKDIHSILLENIMAGGFYRDVGVRITGASHVPPDPHEAFKQIKLFFADFSWKKDEHPIAFAAWTHAEFVRIHPFIDGNGRTARLIMNYQLMAHGFLPVSIPKTRRLEYFTALEAYAVDQNMEPFIDFLAALEEARLDEYLAAYCFQ